MITNRLRFLVLLVGGLVVANLFYWFGAGEPAGRAAQYASSQAFRVEDFALSVSPKEALANGNKASRIQKRDLFYTRPIRKKVRPKRVKTQSKPAAPSKSPEELLREKIEQDINSIHLVGVLQRNGKLQAYVVKEDRTFLIEKGGNIDGEYEIQMLTLEEMVVHHKQTAVKRTIKVSGE